MRHLILSLEAQHKATVITSVSVLTGIYSSHLTQFFT